MVVNSVFDFRRALSMFQMHFRFVHSSSHKKTIMVYVSRPLKRARTMKHSRSKSRQSRKFSSAGPSRTLVPRQSLPEIKRLDSDIGPTVNGLIAHRCFHTEKGTGNQNRIGNSLSMKGIKVKYDLSSTGSNKVMSLYIIRDTEPHSIPPASYAEWQVALFADPLHSSWRTNFRNPDYTERFQIVRKWDGKLSDYSNGFNPSVGYMDIKINGTTAKYVTGEAGAGYPTNVNYYVLYWSGSNSTATHTPLVRIREEFTDN